MKTTTLVFWILFGLVVAIALSFHLAGADMSGWMDGMKKLHGRG